MPTNDTSYRPRISAEIDDPEVLKFYRDHLNDYGKKKAIFNQFLTKIMSRYETASNGEFLLSLLMAGEYDITPRTELKDKPNGNQTDIHE